MFSVSPLKLGAKTPTFPVVPEANNLWLHHAEAADLLGVEARTIGNWMRRPAIREALGAVRKAGQWRIPRPAQIFLWEYETPVRLKAVGIDVPGRLRAALLKRAKACSPYWAEVHRLYLAASAKALLSVRITRKAKEAIDLLCWAAHAVLKERDQRVGVESLKDAVISQLQDRWHVTIPFSLARYWPADRHFAAIKSARKRVEEVRQRLDFVQAVRRVYRMRDARGRRLAPTAENLRPFLHVDWSADLNDTKERRLILPDSNEPCVAPNAGLTDWRSPQLGISLDQFKRRYPLRSNPWCTIVADVYKKRAMPPGSDDHHSDGKTPTRYREESRT